MADKTFEIAIKTSADTTGAQKAKISLEDLKKVSDGLNAELAGTSFDQSGNSGAATARLDTERQITSEKKLQSEASGVAAEASRLEGVNLENASRAAENLTRTIATGGDITQSLSSLFIALEPALGPAAVAAYGLYETLKATTTVAQTLGKLFAGFSIQDLASGLNPESLVHEITLAHEVERALAEIDKQSFTQLQSGLDKASVKLTQLTDLYREAVEKNDGLLEPFGRKQDKIRAAILAQVKDLEEEVRIRQQATNVAQALATLEESRTLQLGRQQELLKTQLEAQRQGTQLDKAFLDARNAALPAADKLTDSQRQIDTIKQHLLDMGVAAKTPNEAFQKSVGLTIDGKIATEAERNEVVKLATEWLNLSGNVKKAQDEIRQFETKRGQGRNDLLSAANPEDIVKAATNLKELNKQAADVLGIKATGPNADLEKSFLDVITNSGAATAKVEQFREALRLLFLQEAAAPKTSAPTATQTADSFLPKIVDIKPPPVAPAPSGELAKGAAQGAAADEAAIKIEQGIQKGVSEEAIKIGNILKEALGSPGVFDPFTQAVKTGTAEMATAVKTAVGNLAKDFKRETNDLQSQIDQLWQAM